MQKRAIAVWMAVLALLSGAAAPAADEVTAETVVERLQGWLDGTRELESRFTQSLESGALGAGESESGRLYLERPGRMRWDYLEPDRKVALVDGNRTRLYLEEESQLIEGLLEDADASILSLLAADSRIQDLFRATLVKTSGKRKGPYRLLLEPIDPDQAYTEVAISVRPPQFSMEAAEVLDGAGNRILYRFEHVRRNRGLPADVFRFVPPPGTEILSRP